MFRVLSLLIRQSDCAGQPESVEKGCSCSLSGGLTRRRTFRFVELADVPDP